MEKLEFVRIDDRLIHGQVVTAWLHAYSKVTHILIVDDKVSQDKFMKEMFKMLVPSHITIDTKSIDDAAELLQAGLPAPTMMIVKEPLTIKKLMEQGIDIPKVNIGGMGMTGKRKKFFQNIAATEEEREMFREMIDKGMTVEVQIIPAAKTVNVATMLK